MAAKKVSALRRLLTNLKSADGRGGGLAILWLGHWDVTLLSIGENYVDVRVKALRAEWRFTGFYGHPYACQDIIPGLFCGN